MELIRGKRMAHLSRGRPIFESEAAHALAVGTATENPRASTVWHPAVCLAVSEDRARCYSVPVIRWLC